MATKNAINNISDPLASTSVTVDPGASGDSCVQFDINSTGKFCVGVDDDDSDNFKISSGSALGTTDRFVMTAGGARTMPAQPAFFYNLETADIDATGAGTTYVLGSGNALTKVFDQNDDFSIGGTFTASVTGRFSLLVMFKVTDIAAAMTDGVVEIVTSLRTYSGSIVSCGVAMSANTSCGMKLETIADMDASDTATFQVTLSNGVGDDADIAVSGANAVTYVCGSLIV